MKKQSYFFITIILFLTGLTIMSGLYVAIPLISVLSKEFSVTEGQTVWVSSLSTFSFAIGCLVFGPLSDRLGRKKVMLSGLVTLSLITFIIGLQNRLLFIILLRVIQGLAMATFSPVVLSYVVELFPQNKRILALSCISTSFLMSGIIGQVFSSYVSAQFGWQYVFMFLSGIYLILSLLFLFFIPNLPANGVSMAIAFKEMRKILKKKTLWFAYVIAFVMMFSFVGMYTSLGTFLSSPPFEFTNQQILYVRSVGIFGMLLPFVVGRLIRRFGVIPVLRSALILSTIGLFLLGIGTNMIFMIVMSVVFVSGIAVAIPSLVSLIGELGGAAKGAAISIYTFVVNSGATMGPILSVQLLNMGNYILTFWVLACFLLVGLLATFLVKR